jgi:hypothetical protein
MMILPRSIEDYVAKDDPVRAYDAFVEKVNLEGGVRKIAGVVIPKCPERSEGLRGIS